MIYILCRVTFRGGVIFNRNEINHFWILRIIFISDRYKSTNFFLSLLTLWKVWHLCFFFVQILPELKKRFVLINVDPIYWRMIKVKILYKISGMKFSSLELKLNGFAVKPTHEWVNSLMLHLQFKRCKMLYLTYWKQWL